MRNVPRRNCLMLQLGMWVGLCKRYQLAGNTRKCMTPLDCQKRKCTPISKGNVWPLRLPKKLMHNLQWVLNKAKLVCRMRDLALPATSNPLKEELSRPGKKGSRRTTCSKDGFFREIFLKYPGGTRRHSIFERKNTWICRFLESWSLDDLIPKCTIFRVIDHKHACSMLALRWGLYCTVETFLACLRKAVALVIFIFPL